MGVSGPGSKGQTLGRQLTLPERHMPHGQQKGDPVGADEFPRREHAALYLTELP